MATWGLAVATFFGIGLSFGGGLLVNSVAQVIALALVPIAVVHVYGGTRLAETLRGVGFVRPRAGAIAGAALVGICSWYVLLRIAVPVLRATQREHVAEGISRAVLGDAVPLPLIFLASALIPGVCEELLHRGVLLRALADRAHRPAHAIIAVITAALVFAIMHLEPARIAATFPLGVAAGWLALRSGSVWPAITLHAVNNAATIAIGTGNAEPVARALGRHPDAGLVVALCGCAGGLALATWASRARSR